MSRSAELKRAGNQLYAAFDAYAEATLAAAPGANLTTLRREFMIAMRTLTVHVADADGLSMEESVAIDHIFWLDGLKVYNWLIREAIAANPEGLQGKIAEVGAAARTWRQQAIARGEADASDDNLIVDAAETIFETVLAADERDDLELDRLTDMISQLRDAASGEATPKAAWKSPSTNVGSAAAKTLNALIGLDSVKREVATLANLAKVFALRRKMQLKVPDVSFHLVFLGNPGTGKTTVARIVAEAYGELGLLSKGHLVEVDRSDLVGGYVGQTALKVAEVIERAKGGVLFIDEAYSLAGGGQNDFGKEAVASLLKAMEDHRDDLVVIAAGYTEEMHSFLGINPGLRSRFTRDLTFDDYSPGEMTRIFKTIAGQAQYLLERDADRLLGELFTQVWERRGPDFANGRDVRNLFERAINQQANRVAMMELPTSHDLRLITLDDLATLMPAVVRVAA